MGKQPSLYCIQQLWPLMSTVDVNRHGFPIAGAAVHSEMLFKEPVTCQKAVYAKVTTGPVHLCQEVKRRIPFNVRSNGVH